MIARSLSTKHARVKSAAVAAVAAADTVVVAAAAVVAVATVAVAAVAVTTSAGNQNQKCISPVAGLRRRDRVKYPIFSLLFSLLVFFSPNSYLQVSAAESRPNENAVVFYCADKKRIYARIALTGPGRVSLKLSDGRSIKLPQVMSASGVKYADDQEKFIFWTKADTAFILENDQMTHRDCVSR